MRFNGSLNGSFPVWNNVTSDYQELRAEFSGGLQSPVEVTRMHVGV